jgi:hypothetical protein
VEFSVVEVVSANEQNIAIKKCRCLAD